MVDKLDGLPLGTCVACGRDTHAAHVGVVTVLQGGGPRDGAEAWICEDCAQDRDRARAFVRLAHQRYPAHSGHGKGHWLGKGSITLRVVSPLLASRDPDNPHGGIFHDLTRDVDPGVPD
jgi:hypothetical protein